MAWYSNLLILLGVTILPLLVGSHLARLLRMSDYGWKLGLIFATLAAAVTTVALGWPPKRGIDLSGGVILIYEVDEQQSRRAQSPGAAADEPIDMGALVQALNRRINPGGVKELVIRPYGEQQVEIIVPQAEDAEIKQIKRMITQSGFLTFRIVANASQHPQLFSLADDPAQATAKEVRDEQGHVVGEWVRLALEEGSTPESPRFKVPPGPDNKTRELRPGRVDILTVVDPLFNVEGRHLHAVRSGFDDSLTPCVNFQMSSEGATLFGGLTASNLPDRQAGRYSLLGIVMDGELISAPRILSTITDQGQITGRFTQEEVDFLVNVLRAGKLPAVLRSEPINENNISPLLGEDTIRKGQFAITISLIAVLAFMLVYYRFAGLVACLALVLNLVLILALMILVRAAFTLPGLAGLVLTVGMSVDANVLIYERIREELKRGAALRMAIRNGFARATTTIVDANVTTLITGVVLYAIGTDQIRGFAVTLILGILMSMYTAIFCSRVVFDIAERKRWMTRLRMMQFLGDHLAIDFIGWRRFCMACSVAMIAIGLAGMAVRGQRIFDIDFLGGTSVEAMLVQPMPTAEVRSRVAGIADDYSVTQVNPEGRASNTIYKIDTSLQDSRLLEEELRKRFQDPAGKLLLVTHALNFSAPQPPSPPATRTSASGTAQPPDGTGPSAGPAGQDSRPTPGAAPGAQPVGPDGAGPADAPGAEPSGPGVSEEAQPPSDSAEVPAQDKGAVRGRRSSELLWALADGGLTLLAQADAGAPVEDLTPAEAKPGDAPAPPEATRGADTGQEEAPPADAQPAEADAPAPTGGETPAADGIPTETEPEGGTNRPAKAGPAATEPGNAGALEPADSSPADEEAASAPTPPPNHWRSEAELRFDEKFSAESLESELRAAAQAVELPVPEIELFHPRWDGSRIAGFSEWSLKMTSTPQEAEAILRHLKAQLETTPVWLSSSKIGGKVAGDTQQLAILSLVASLLGIVAYIWLRFHRVVYGLAAVVALVHDVLITLGAIALSLWLSKFLGFLLIDEFKISLPVVAALLTIIGYSLNDTIIIFDRIREVKGKSPQLTGAMVNASINQTLSRTLLTSGTTLLVLAILYTLGGEGIHGFAFALLVGIVVGTYSSIFVASPILLWLEGSERPSTARKKVTV